MSMKMQTAEEYLQDVSAVLSVCMSVINSHLDDGLTLPMAEDLFFSLRAAQRLAEMTIDGLPADNDIFPIRKDVV